jgi:hypothetical protein
MPNGRRAESEGNPVQRNVSFVILRPAAEINDLAHPHTFAGAEAEMPDREQREEQVRRILRSATFRNASTLQQLLTYLASKSAAGTVETPKEYTIGLEALGRKEDFDPKIDPIVRVQSHRLRTKLKEYYAVEGSQDPILIQIPKGHYLPTFEFLPAGSSILPDIRGLPDAGTAVPVPDEAIKPEAEKDPPIAPAANRAGWSTTKRLVAAAICLSIGVLGFWIGKLYSGINSGGKETPAWRNGAVNKDVVESFWARFLNDDRSPVIAYPDAVFLLDDSNDLFRYRRGASDGRGGLVEPHLARQFASNPKLVEKAGQLYYENGYTGTGELEAVAMLSGLLGRMGIKPTIKSSRDLTPDDLNQHNVILLGSPFQNVAVAQLLTSGDFVFQNPDQRHEQWRAQIVNAHPKPGESGTYGTERDPDTRVLGSDYSLITIAPGVVPGRYIADLGGLDTKGTQGAAMFATSSFGVEQLTRALGPDNALPASGPPIFQALVRVQLAKGYQVLGAELTSLHPMAAANSSRPKIGGVAARQ